MKFLPTIFSSTPSKQEPKQLRGFETLSSVAQPSVWLTNFSTNTRKTYGQALGQLYRKDGYSLKC